MSKSNKTRLEETYNSVIKSKLQQELGIENIMDVPKIRKVVLNVGVKEAVSDLKDLNAVVNTLTIIAGQRPVRRVARKSIAGFKLREGRPIGAMVTLRGKQMYEFLDRLISLALPNIRDFQGVPRRFDGRGNYNLGLKEISIFPEIEFGQKVHGLNVTIQTTAKTDAHGLALLEGFGFPFRRSA